MLDVHPPHHAANTWRDFFVHIATIVIGLLIAIGLEQTVEAVHRHNERRELERNLLREARDNVERLEIGRRSWFEESVWLHSVILVLNQAPMVNGRVSVTLPSRPAQGNSSSPTRAVWTVAKATGTLSLLPEGAAEVAEHVEYEAEQEEATFNEAVKARRAQQAMEMRFGLTLAPGAMLRVTSAQRDALLQVLADSATAVSDEALWLAACEGADEAVVAGVTTRSGMMPYIKKAVSRNNGDR